MRDIARVKVISGNRACRVEAIGYWDKGALAGTSPRARSIERRDGAASVAHEAAK